MKKVFIVVDMQNDFCGPEGSLSTLEAQAIVNKVADQIRARANKDTILLVTKDTHEMNYMETLEGKNLPVPHCIKNTYGWELAPAIQEAIYDTRDQYFGFDSYFPYVADHIVCKPTFGSMDIQNLLFVIDDLTGMQPGEIAEITLCGLCTGICVLSNAILCKATMPEVPIKVIEDCCACVTPASHQTALDAMKLCQIEII